MREIKRGKIDFSKLLILSNNFVTRLVWRFFINGTKFDFNFFFTTHIHCVPREGVLRRPEGEAFVVFGGEDGVPEKKFKRGLLSV